VIVSKNNLSLISQNYLCWCYATYNIDGIYDSQGRILLLSVCVRVRVCACVQGYQGMVDGGEQIELAEWKTVSNILHKVQFTVHHLSTLHRFNSRFPCELWSLRWSIIYVLLFIYIQKLYYVFRP